MTITFKGHRLKVIIDKYVQDNSPAILLEQEDGEPFTVATMWIENIPEGCVAVKNYSENAGILEVLQAALIVGPVKQHIETGYVTLPVCELLFKG